MKSPPVKQSHIENKLFSHRKITDSGCWLWTGFIEKHGYGRTTIKGLRDLVHRFSAFTYLDYDLGCSLIILHKVECKNKHCFNPSHLYIGSYKDNAVDREMCKTHCPQGHPKTKFNTYEFKSKDGITYKCCIICKREREHSYRREKVSMNT